MLKHRKGGVLGPEEISLASTVFESVMEHDDQQRSVPDPQLLRQRVADAIISNMLHGERDVRRLQIEGLRVLWS